MKIKSIFIASIIFALAFSSCSDSIYEPEQPQDLPISRSAEIAVCDTTYKYAYYYDQKVEIPIDESKKYVIVEEAVADVAVSAPTKTPAQYRGYIVDTNELISTTSLYVNGSSNPIIAIEDVTVDGTPLNNYIYVGLKDVTDLPQLEKLADNIGCKMLGSILDEPKWIKLETTTNSRFSSLEASAYLYENGDFKFVDPGFQIKYETNANYTPSDPFFSQQWNLTGQYGINILPAWEITKGSSDITLAIYDKGVNTNVGEFTGRLTDFSYNLPFTINEDHGTNVAMIAAASHNNLLFAGVAPGVKIMNCYTDFYSSEQLAQGFIAAYTNGADIINCSWGGSKDDRSFYHVLEEACKKAINEGRNGKGCVVVFAAGNNKGGSVNYPQRNLPESIIVSATDNYGKLASISSKGTEVTVAAPGQDIPVLIDGILSTDKGTSYAAPQVSGLAALILSIRPELTAAQVKQLIIETASNPTHSNDVGWGIINAGYAVRAANGNFSITCPDHTVISPNKGTIYYTLSGVPRGATVKWTSATATRLISSSNTGATFQYPTTGTSLSNETITADVTYLGKTTTVSYQCTITHSTVVSSINILEGFDGIGANQIHLFADCSRENAPLTWEITSSSGCNFQLIDFPYADDASFMYNQNAYKTVRYGDPLTPITSIPDGAYCEITVEVNEPYGVWRRATLRYQNVWTGYEWVIEDNGALR